MHAPLLLLAAALAAAQPAPAPARAAAPPAAEAPQPPKAPDIPYQQFKLANGLNLLLHEDHTTPIVAVDVHYDVGSKDEKPGRTGFAHLFEHLMFQGSEHLPKGKADELIEAAGGSANGSTSFDVTNYWQQVPSNALEQALFIEADRMGFLLPVVDQAKLDNQRDVVRNERRQNYEMQPYGEAFKVLMAELWDPEFPYHWLPIGTHEDLAAATLEDVKEFFRRWYGPNNATLAIAGDIDPAETRALVEKWFGPIPSSPTPERSYPQPKPLTREKRITQQDDVQLPRIHVAWQTPKIFADGDAALDLAGAILSSGKSSRLVKRLVMDRQTAQSVSAGQSSQELASAFLVVATPKPGQDPARLLAEIDEELARLARTPPSAVELERARNKAESSMIFGLEPVGGFGGRAATLNRYYLSTGDPGFFAEDLARYRAVTAQDVQRAVATYLRKDARVVLTIVPGKKPGPQPSAPPPSAARAAPATSRRPS
jgi:zinc protease